MNATILQGRWRRMRGNLKTEWGRLTDNDRRILDGKIDQMMGLVQERYGYTQRNAAKMLTHYVRAYNKRRHNRTATPTKVWGPALSVAALFSLAAMGWFFFSRFLTENPEEPEEPFAEPDYLASPEAELV